MVLLKRLRWSIFNNRKQTLHSTMVLLKLCYTLHVLIARRTLHSTMVLLKLWSCSKPAPDPDPFTFHYGLIKTIILINTKNTKKSFTFHYGLIKTITGNTCNNNTNIFTFHYGLIKTFETEGKPMYFQTSLHSTMVLLKRSCPCFYFCPWLPLHSTMVLLKLKSQQMPMTSNSTFTFHYGLIKTYRMLYLF